MSFAIRAFYLKYGKTNGWHSVPAVCFAHFQAHFANLTLKVGYFFFIWKVRGQIALSDRRALTTKSMLYWLALGIIMFLTYDTPVAAIDFWSVRIFFIIFTLLLADSYWDFKKMSLKCLLKEKERC